MKKRLSFILLLLWCISSQGYAQVSFTTQVDAKRIVAGSAVNVSFTLKNADGTAFRPPAFKGLTKISGPSTNRSMSFVNGKSTSSTSYVYTLLGEKAGVYSIGGATIKVNGKSIKSKPISVQVIKGKAANQIKDKKNFVRIEVSDSTAVIGQQIVLEYVIYFQQDLSG